jgi:IS1 family transposase
VWKAYCRTIGELVDWECGNRRAQTLKLMLDRLRALDVRFFADNWGVCGVDFVCVVGLNAG